MGFSKHGRFSTETGQELDAIDPKASSHNKSSKVLSAPDICRRILRLVWEVMMLSLRCRKGRLTKIKCIASLLAPLLAKELRRIIIVYKFQSV
jgi:hypothetical protein